MIVGNFYTGETLETRKDMRKNGNTGNVERMLILFKVPGNESIWWEWLGHFPGLITMEVLCLRITMTTTVWKDLRGWNIAQLLAAQAWGPKFEHLTPHKKPSSIKDRDRRISGFAIEEDTWGSFLAFAFLIRNEIKWEEDLGNKVRRPNTWPPSRFVVSNHRVSLRSQ